MASATGLLLRALPIAYTENFALLKAYGPVRTQPTTMAPPTAAIQDVVANSSRQFEPAPPVPFIKWGSAEPTASPPIATPIAKPRPYLYYIAE
jgi:hypothetical protein